MKPIYEVNKIKPIYEKKPDRIINPYIGPRSERCDTFEALEAARADYMAQFLRPTESNLSNVPIKRKVDHTPNRLLDQL